MQPQRILVYGVTGSGKSTAAVEIGERTELPVTLADDLTWLPGWVPVAQEEQRAIFAEMASGERWVLDSAYGDWLDVVLARAEVVVALDYPRWFSLQRLLRRTVRRAVTQQPVCNGNTESWRQLVSGDSIVVWHFRSFARKRARIRAWLARSEDADAPEVIWVRRPRELAEWLTGLEPSGRLPP